MAKLKPFQLKRLLQTDGPAKTFDSLFTSTVPCLFDGPVQFSEWQARIAAAVKQPDAKVHLCGSVLFGFSLDPAKAWRPFSSESRKTGYVSDLDVVVVSEGLFREAWDAVLDAHRKLTLTLTTDERRHMAGNLFKGFISDYHVPSSSIGFERVLAVRRASGTHVATTGFTTNMRFYRTFEDYRWYQITSLATL
ncbi:hypothetical protein [Opitutus terrae]|uniref:Uncharacterized protein n=1 Tax=Opitutus terrae (strain DSM 11246 / JCM 15787 / PB90-1) TaxID=452637 RepID=B1ZPS9_OPITP|nr:hypothetical protein [Opitutus terrae]ACB75532.1 hypothetical protein Oter_2249 [Opitutus terrae PB90-1]